jgi:hypothetical protein
MDSFAVPSKVQCAFKFAEATSLELLYPPMGGSTGSELLLLQELTVRIAKAIKAGNIRDKFFVAFFIFLVFVLFK